MSTRARRAAAAIAALVLVSLGAATPLGAQPAIELALPIDCRPGIDCHVQNHVDSDPGPAARDYTCGRLTYDGHDGTDLRLLDMAAMRRGVAVLASAPGKVMAARDGVADDGLAGPSVGEGRHCGNGVRVEHAGGWETQYCHLRQGSVAVAVGQAVKTGDRLGLVGLSGNTEFPHVELVVRYRGETVDPFQGRLAKPGCGQEAKPLWRKRDLAALAYRPSGLLGSGFTDRTPEAAAAREGEHHAERLGSHATSLVFWVDLFGVQQADIEEMALYGPDGARLVAREDVRPEPKAQWFRFFGRRRPEAGWPPGRYRAEYRLIRKVGDARRAVIEVKREVEIR